MAFRLLIRRPSAMKVLTISHRRFFCVLGLVSFTTSQLSAVTLARWTPVSIALPRGEDYDQGTDTPAPDEFAANLVVSSLVREDQNFSNPGVNWPGLATVGAFDVNAGFTEFTVTPQANFEVSYEQLTYDANTFGGGNTAEGYTVSVRSSLDMFASIISSQTLANFITGRFTLPLDNLGTVSEAVTFRIYAVDDSGATGNRFFDLLGSNTDSTQGLIVTGEVVPIPEPSTFLFCSLALVGLGVRRKK